MRRNFTWPITFCAVPLLAAAWASGLAWMHFGDPTATGLQFNLGVDLAGGTILVYEGKDKLDDPSKFPSDQLAAALRKRIDPSALRAITDAMPTQPEGARDFVRRIRDGERY